MNTWTQLEAIELCKKIESVCQVYGCHVALTGGLLYKEGNRKDADLLFYRIRQIPVISYEILFKTLNQIGINNIRGFGFVFKGEYLGKTLDMLFPEESKGEYKKI